MTTVEARTCELGRRLGIEDIDDSLRAAALAYARSYRGDFAFMKEMSVAAERGLSDRQIVAVLNCLWAEAHADRPRGRSNEARERGRDRRGIDLVSVADGCYAAPDGNGELIFLRIERPVSGRWSGWVLVDQILGGDNKRPQGYQRPGGVYRGPVEHLLAAVLADPIGASALCGRELGVCGLCGRTLTVAASRARGIGPTCAKRLSAGLHAHAAALAGRTARQAVECREAGGPGATTARADG